MNSQERIKWLMAFAIAGVVLLGWWKAGKLVKAASDAELQNESVILGAGQLLEGDGRKIIHLNEVAQQLAGLVATNLQSESTVKETAGVLWAGKIWFYKALEGGQFVRCSESELLPGDVVVTTGAQILLSEEFGSKIEVEGEGN